MPKRGKGIVLYLGHFHVRRVSWHLIVTWAWSYGFFLFVQPRVSPSFVTHYLINTINNLHCRALPRYYLDASKHCFSCCHFLLIWGLLLFYFFLYYCSCNSSATLYAYKLVYELQGFILLSFSTYLGFIVILFLLVLL